MNTRQNKEGSTLILVVGIMTIISITLAMLHKMANQQVHSTIIVRDKLKARMIAESGLNRAYHLVRNNFNKLEGLNFTDEFSDGRYTITSKTFSGDLSSRGQLTSVGICGRGKSIVAADLENFPIGGSGDGSGASYFQLEHDILVGGTLWLSGNFTAHVTDIHSNGSGELKGSSATDATVISSSRDVSWKKAPDNVTLLANQPPEEIYPESLQAAVQSFIDFAIDNGAVYSSGSGIPNNIPGGVAVYTGTDKLMLHGNYNGTIIVLGSDVHMNAKSTINAPNGYPSLIALGPNEVKINANAEVHGAVLIPNAALRFNGCADIYGPILVGQGLRGIGTADLYAGSGQGFSLPPEEEVSLDKVVITAWH